MKRSWFGFLLLTVLLILSLSVTWVMRSIHAPVSRELHLAAELALAEDWAEANARAKSAETAWKTFSHVRLCFADHTPAEDIDAEFAALAAYGAKKETADFAAACLSLTEQVNAIGQAHGLTLWNLF